MNDFIIQSKSDIGLIREKNEDATLALVHPRNRDVKLLAVADGMGGKDHGDIASIYVVNELYKWFKSSRVDSYDDVEKVEKRVCELVEKINVDLLDTYGENRMGTTLTLALILNEKTIVLNCGDSRCYRLKDAELEQITEDASRVWHYYESGVVNKDDLRFFSTSNYITSCIGLGHDMCNIKTKVIDNDYDTLLLVTDGVTDLLSDKKIKEILLGNNKKIMLDKIIQEAVYIDQKLRVPTRLRRNFDEYFYVPSRGKDNASGVIYIKNNE